MSACYDPPPQQMHVTLISYLLWGVSSALELVLCLLAFHRRLHRRLPFFVVYLTLLVGRDLFGWWVYLRSGYNSRFAFIYFWATQTTLLAARGAAITEIALRALRDYRGVWALAWRILLGVALMIGIYAGVATAGSASRVATLILTAERGLELAAVAILVSLLCIRRYYGIEIDYLHRRVALGLGVYSAVQVLNNSLLKVARTEYFQWWSEVRVLSFLVVLLIWFSALLRPLPGLAPSPVLIPKKLYDELSLRVNYRLRALNERLLEMLKS